MDELVSWKSEAVTAAAPVARAPRFGADPAVLALFRRAAVWLGGAVAVIGALGLVAHFGHLPRLGSLRPDWVVMKVNTALGLVALGAALAGCARPQPKRGARVLAALVGLLGVATLFEYATGLDLGIDELLGGEAPGAAATVHPGRMAIVTAVCFVLDAGALLTLHPPERRLRWLSDALALPTLSLGLIAGLGYAFGVEEVYSWAGSFTAIAAPTSAALVLLSAGALLAGLENGVLRWLASPASGGVMLRRLLPVAALAPIVFVWLRLKGQSFGLFSTPEFGAALVAVANMLVFSTALVLCAALLDRLDAQRGAGEMRITGLNEQLSRHVRELEGANRELEGFAYAMGHVLRAPLRAMDGFSRILLDDYGPKLDAEAVRMLGVIRSSATDMALLIDGIGEFLRLARSPLALAEVDMTAQAKAALDALAPKMEGRKIEVQVAALPTARADPDMISRVWLQLLDNAVKFTGGRPQAVIEVGATRGSQETTYFVRDNGVGFDMKYADKLWGVFNRLHGSEFAGDGMGLAIVQRIVLRHGGLVWAEGKPGEGAAFFFSLPTSEAGDA